MVLLGVDIDRLGLRELEGKWDPRGEDGGLRRHLGVGGLPTIKILDPITQTKKDSMRWSIIIKVRHWSEGGVPQDLLRWVVINV